MNDMQLCKHTLLEEVKPNTIPLQVLIMSKHVRTICTRRRWLLFLGWCGNTWWWRRRHKLRINILTVGIVVIIIVYDCGVWEIDTDVSLLTDESLNQMVTVVQESCKMITCCPAGLQRPHSLPILPCLILSNLTDVRIINCIFSAFHPTWMK